MSERSRSRLGLAGVAVACLVSAPVAAMADTPADAGLKLAQRYCTRCHVVVPSASKGWTDAPAFQTIANHPEWTPAALSRFIQQPHMHMLNTGRPVDEANEIAAYIVSLKRGEGAGDK